MNKTVKTTASAIMAAAIGASVFIAVENNNGQSNDNDFSDDITAIQVEVPQVDRISIELPEIIPAEIETSINETEQIASSMNDTEPVVMPEIVIENLDADVPRYAALVKEQHNLLRDKRNIQYDPALKSLRSTNWDAWTKIYHDPQYQNYIMEYKPLSAGLRIINEVWCPKDQIQFQTLIHRLEKYHQWGYNAVLVCFDTTEKLLNLICTVDYIKSTGMKVIIVYTGGKESLHDSVFRNPDIIRNFLTALSPKADALLLGWWRTSVHLFIPDPAYTNFIVKNARMANPELPVIGQAYWGQTAETGTDHKNFRVTVDLPENSSAVLIMGMGYPGSASRQTLHSLFTAVAGHPHKIALVAGEKPYFDTRYSTNRTVLENQKIKRNLELRLLRIGFQSTMTFSGDGSNGIYNKDKSENLCQEYQ